MPNLPTSQATPGGRRVPLFGNDHCSVVLADADAHAGLSQGREQAITRWREHVCCDDLGNFIVPRGMDSRVLWSLARQPFAACGAPR